MPLPYVALVAWLVLMTCASVCAAFVAVAHALHRHHQAHYWRCTAAHLGLPPC